MYAITLHQPWASLIALGVKTVETRSWPAPARLMGQTIAIHAGKRVVRKPGVAVENEMRARLGEDWHRTIPAGAVLATAILGGMARVERVDPRAGLAVHDPATLAGRVVGLGQTRIDPWGDFSAGRWLWGNIPSSISVRGQAFCLISMGSTVTLLAVSKPSLDSLQPCRSLIWYHVKCVA